MSELKWDELFRLSGMKEHELLDYKHVSSMNQSLGSSRKKIAYLRMANIGIQIGYNNGIRDGKKIGEAKK